MSDLIDEKNNEYYRLIKQALDTHKLAFMIGAGVSIATDIRNPSWPNLINTLKLALDDCEEEDYLKVAQLYYIKYGALNLKNTVQSQFPPKDIPNDIQEGILQLNPHYIITTNWDCYFDNVVKENLQYPYDIVADDRELVLSENDNKIIKMHGDFSHGNYVFTEDDYLNYSYNFPLIENYVKSIFSTHAIVMLGYSFNDIDLKQIVTWFQNHSDQQPPVYMVVYDFDEYQQQYLEKFGIKLIVVKNKDKTEGLKSFIRSLKKDKKIFASNPALYVVNKLKGLKQLKIILQRHLLKSLTNCTIDYLSDSDAFLHFLDSFMSVDFDEEKRKIYREYVEKIDPSKPNNQIISVLTKSGLNGIITSKDNDSNRKYVAFEKKIESDEIISFLDDALQKKSNKIESLAISVAFLYMNKKLEDAYNKCNEFLILSKKNYYYDWMLIGLYNHNVILNELQNDLSLRKKYLEKVPEDIEKIFLTLPKDVQRDYMYLRDFLQKKDLYEMLFWTNQAVEKKKEQVYCIENKGACWDTDVFEYEHELKNLIEFIIGNGICMENDPVYRKLCESYIKIAFLRKSVKEEFSLNKIELFACIKYISTKNLQKYLQSYVIKKNVKITFDVKVLNWLIDNALTGLVKKFKSQKNIHLEYDKCILHTLILLSINKLDNNQSHKIFALINNLVSNSLNTPIIFRAINIFFKNQYFLQKRKYDDKEIADMFERLLYRFVTENVNGHEYDAICRHGLGNIFNIIDCLAIKIESVDLIKKMIFIISQEKDEKEKVSFCEIILLNLYGVTNKVCQKEIKNFLNKQNFTKSDFLMNIKLINYKIKLINVGIKNNIKEVLKDLNKILDNFNTSVMCSDLNYTCALFNIFTMEQKKS